jgi:hypothetical protein
MRGLCLVLLLLSSPALADDGSWSTDHELSEGPLYAVSDDPAIALDKELLVLDNPLDGSVTALFAFRNTSDQAVTVEAGFPVVLDLPLEPLFERNGKLSSRESGTPVYFITQGKYGGFIGSDLLALTGLKLRQGKPEDETDWEWEGTFIRKADFAKKRVAKKVPKKTPFRFAITQDDKPVKLDQLIVELDPDSKSSEVVFHFRHRLVFAPGQTSMVRVSYQSPTLSAGIGNGSGSGTLEYTWRYVLRTGSTWKGPLGQLLLVIPDQGVCEGEDSYTPLGRWAGYRVVQRTAFEPGASDDIVCKWKDPDGQAGWDDFWFGSDPNYGPERGTWESL